MGTNKKNKKYSMSRFFWGTHWTLGFPDFTKDVQNIDCKFSQVSYQKHIVGGRSLNLTAFGRKVLAPLDFL